MSFLDLAKSKIPNQFDKLTVGILKQIFEQENLSDDTEICFEARVSNDYDVFGFNEYRVGILRDEDTELKHNRKLVLMGEGCYGYDEQYEDDEDDEEDE